MKEVATNAMLKSATKTSAQFSKSTDTFNYTELAQDLLVRVTTDGRVLLIWKKVCDFKGTCIIRTMCEDIDRRSADSFMNVLHDEGLALSTYGGLRLDKIPNECHLTFTRTFLNPKSLALSLDEQKRLIEILLQVQVVS